MAIGSINPATGEEMESFDALKDGEIEACLARAEQASPQCPAESFTIRGQLLAAVASRLRDNKQELARPITREMGELTSYYTIAKPLSGSCLMEARKWEPVTQAGVGQTEGRGGCRRRARR
jgi:acyl-CoA reductase-like NAD-dependent aldehyde dehydrogenase